MTELWHANLVRVFDFYLAMMLVLGLWRRYPIYWNTFRILWAVQGRWPKLLQRMKQHHNILVTRDLIRPLLVVLGLMALQFTLSRWLYPEARISLSNLSGYPFAWLGLVIGVLPMLAVDSYFLVMVGQFDRVQTEKSLDEAEAWLGGWKSTAVRVATLGYINPLSIVDQELKKGLTSLGKMASFAAWWVSIQVACRTTCGLTIWTLWFLLSSSGSS